MVCCKSPSAINYDRKSIFWCAASRQVLWVSLEGGMGLCADKVPLTPYVTGMLQMFPWFPRVLLWSSLIFLCFPLVVKCFPSAPFSFPVVFSHFPLIFLVASFGVNVNYSRKSIFLSAASRRVLFITIESQYSGVLQVAKCCKFK